MPNDAPATKRAATRDYGATIVEYDPEKASREDIAKELENAARLYDDSAL